MSIIRTPWDELNELLQGGLESPEIGIIASPAGSGKSWVLQNIAAQALRDKKSVLYYSCDTSLYIIFNRLASIISGIPIKEITTDQNADILLGKKLTKKLYVINPPMSVMTIDNVYDSINRVESHLGKRLDLLIIDSISLMLSINMGTSYRNQFLHTLLELDQLALRHKLPIWSAVNCRSFNSSDEQTYLNDIDISFVGAFDIRADSRNNECDFIVFKDKTDYNEPTTLNMTYDWTNGSIKFS